jgi:hypothetical protein
MKYAIIPYVALGMMLSLTIGIEYHCEGQEMFPTSYGSPFVFKRQSLGSSMEYFFSILGVLLNVLLWSFFLFLIDKAIHTIIGKRSGQKWIQVSYKVVVGLLLAFTTLNIAIDSTMIGRGFDRESNYWYWDLDNEAKKWGVTCNGEIITFRK